MLKVTPSGKTAYSAKSMPKQFSASPSSILGTTENATFAQFMMKSMHLNTAFLLDYQVLFLLLSGPQIKKRFIWVLQVNRGHIMAFYMPNFRLQT